MRRPAWPRAVEKFNASGRDKVVTWCPSCHRHAGTFMTGVNTAQFTVSHITELKKSRAVIQELTGSRALPQLLVRVGNAPVAENIPAPTPRLPLSAVMQMKLHEGRSARCPQP